MGTVSSIDCCEHGMELFPLNYINTDAVGGVYLLMYNQGSDGNEKRAHFSVLVDVAGESNGTR